MELRAAEAVDRGSCYYLGEYGLVPPEVLTHILSFVVIRARGNSASSLYFSIEENSLVKRNVGRTQHMKLPPAPQKQQHSTNKRSHQLSDINKYAALRLRRVCKYWCSVVSRFITTATIILKPPYAPNEARLGWYRDTRRLLSSVYPHLQSLFMWQQDLRSLEGVEELLPSQPLEPPIQSLALHMYRINQRSDLLAIKQRLEQHYRHLQQQHVESSSSPPTTTSNQQDQDHQYGDKPSSSLTRLQLSIERYSLKYDRELIDHVAAMLEGWQSLPTSLTSLAVGPLRYHFEYGVMYATLQMTHHIISTNNNIKDTASCNVIREVFILSHEITSYCTEDQV